MTRTMTMRYLGLFAALAISLLLMAPPAAAELRLLPRIVVEGEDVTLADMFGDIGEAGGAIVSRAPRPGKRLSISVARVNQVVSGQDLDWTPMHALRSVIVSRASRAIPAFEIETVILGALVNETTSDGLTISLANPNQVFHVAKNAARDLAVEDFVFDTRTGRFVVSLVAASGTVHEARAEFTGQAIETVELPVLNKLLKKGEIITDGDIRWLAWQANRIPRTAITDIDDLVGMAAKRRLSPGRLLGMRDVSEPTVAVNKPTVAVNKTVVAVKGSVAETQDNRRIPAFEIQAVILEALIDETAGDGFRINLANRSQVFYVARDAAIGLEVENLDYDAVTGRFEASLIAASGTPDEVRAEYRGRAVETIELPVLISAVKKGEIIGEGDLEWVEWQVRRMPRDAIVDSADLVGLAANRSLRPGAPLRGRDVSEPIVVAKGSAVRLVYRTSMMVLTAGGRALEDGAMGSVIRVRNSQSKVVVEARVEGGNILSVTLNASMAFN